MVNQENFLRSRGPIFVLGVMQRSGTNYLNNLLLLHPNTRPPGIVWEDFHLAHAERLMQYVEENEKHWSDEWRESLDAKLGSESLLKHIGSGIIEFMKAQSSSAAESGDGSAGEVDPSLRMVSATPSVRNIDLFFRLFPEATPIIVVRNGAALVESGVRSFHWDYEEAMRMWARSARQILNFFADPLNQERALLVRYVDLVNQIRPSMERVLDFVGLDKNAYDFHAAENMVVMGSSDVKGKDGALHWNALEKPADFNPLDRAKEWGPQLWSRFAWIASEEMHALGFVMEKAPRRPLWNRLLDRIYGFEAKLRPRFAWISNVLRRLRLHILRVPTK